VTDFLDRLRQANTTRCDRWHPPDTEPWLGVDWSNAMQSEAGEAGNIVKKLRRHETGARNEGDPSPAELLVELADEIADTAIYLDLLAAFYGIDLADAIAAKFDRTSEKFGFPERLSTNPEEEHDARR
jgi:NTP pyrophosphatase (non-canonical NTP hydrolase)